VALQMAARWIYAPLEFRAGLRWVGLALLIGVGMAAYFGVGQAIGAFNLRQFLSTFRRRGRKLAETG
jgi:putative peptidoglycan lipid II flippase